MMMLTPQSGYRPARPLATLRRLLLCQSGSSTALMTAAFIPVLVALGGGIDLGRGYVVKSQLQTAVDAAALAAAQSCATTTNAAGTQIADTSKASPQATSYFRENFVNGYMGTSTSALTQNEMCTGTSFMRVALTGTATVPYSIMKIVGFTNKTISATAVAETGSDPATIEATMVLDVTGSMTAALGSTTRIESLKLAAKDFVNIVYQNQENRNSVALGIVPYNITVNLGQWGKDRVGSTIQSMPGYNTAFGIVPARLQWSGCVENDATVTTMTNDVNFQDTGAWDIRTEIAGIGGSAAPQITPFLYRPSWIRTSLTADKANGTSDYYKHSAPANTPSFQDARYRLASNTIDENNLANLPVWKDWFYKQYIGLNNGPGTATDDVIVPLSGTGYYADGSGLDYRVLTERIPYYSDINQFPVSSAYSHTALDANSPNQQCPAPMRVIQYGNTMSSHKTWIDSNIVAHRPGGGTIHHSGMLWGARMLQNTAAFPRTNPTVKTPKRVVLFMTDGNYEFSDWSTNADSRAKWYDALYSLYGRLKENRLFASTDPEVIQAKSSLRFAKICQAVKNEGAVVYVVALAITDTTSDSMFSACAPGDKYKKAATNAQLREAFSAIAREIVDLHLVS